MAINRSLVLLSLLVLLSCAVAAKSKQSYVEKVDDLKVFKKLLKTRLSVLVLFSGGDQAVKNFYPVFEKVAGAMAGQGTLVYVNCKDAKKMCKNLKVSPGDAYTLKHYMNGVFNKDYDRRLVEKSLLNFLQNPTADAPWSEDVTSADVRHIETVDDFTRLLTKTQKPILVMFYAPWCGHCKALKPHFAEAASELKSEAVLAGMDLEKPELYGVRQALNITGFPTLHYYLHGNKVFDYGGERTKEGILTWMRDPKPPAAGEKEAESSWEDEESEVVHLLEDTFNDYLSEHSSILVMFYAPWCGHCKAMKPHYTEAAQRMKEEGIEGTLAAVDATKARSLAEQYGVKGFPTIKYFKDGELQYDYGYARETDALVGFMREPSEPPPPPPPEPEWRDTPSAVHHLDGDNFGSILKKKRHALVMFYAPWCGHCKAAKPEFTAAAERLKAEKKKALAAVDCTKNQELCTEYEVQGFPTFKYFSYGKNPAQYSGGRKEDDFVQFMQDPDGSHSEL